MYSQRRVLHFIAGHESIRLSQHTERLDYLRGFIWRVPKSRQIQHDHYIIVYGVDFRRRDVQTFCEYTAGCVFLIQLSPAPLQTVPKSLFLCFDCLNAVYSANDNIVIDIVFVTRLLEIKIKRTEAAHRI